MLIIFLSLLSFNIFALEVSFVGPCSEKPFYSTNVNSTEALNVGELTLIVLKEKNIPFKGTEAGLNQVMDSPIGLEAMEVVSDQEMMAYGWCYEVDGKILESYPHEVQLDGIKVIKWFYGYAHYLNGKWVAQCLKSYKRQSRFICEK